MESKINCNVAAAISLWIIAFAVSNVLCVTVNGPFEKRFELKATGIHRTSDNFILQWHNGTIYLYKYTNEDKYTIGHPENECINTFGLPEPDELVDEKYSFETNEIKYHIMHREFINLELKNDLSLALLFGQLADAQIFYGWSSHYEYANRSSAGPFELLIISKVGAQNEAVLTIYEIDNENILCEFKEPDDESSYDATRIGLIAQKMGNFEAYYILKFYKDEDAVNFFNAIHGKSKHVTQKSNQLASLDGTYAMHA